MPSEFNVESGSKLPPKLSPEELNRPVRRKQVGPGTVANGDAYPQAEAAPEPRPEKFKSDPAWDKLLLVVGVAMVVVALFVFPGILNHGGKNPVAEAAQATMDSPGVRLSMTGSGSVGGTAMTIEGSGVINGDQHRAQFQMTMNGQASSGSQRISLAEILDGTDYYIHMPELNQALGGGQAWLLIRGKDLGNLFNQSGGGIGGGGAGSNPQAQLDMLQSTSDVTSLGQEQIDGVTTTHYTGVVDFNKILDQASGQLPDDLVNQVKQEFDSLNATETVDAWIDQQGRIRRETANASFGGLGTMAVTMNFTDYGIHPQIQVPSPAEAQDITPLLQQGMGQLFQNS